MTGGNIILIVDDAELNREIIAEAFGDEYIILQAENGVQAMKILRGHRRNLAAVFLDIMMPKMNGYEVLSEMKNQNLLFEIPVIVVTGMVDVSEKDSIIRKGASDVLFKPVNTKMILDSFNKVLDVKNYRKKLETSVKVTELPAGIKYQDIMDAVMSIMKHPNMEKPGHMLRVSEYVRDILTEYAKIDKKSKLSKDKINYMAEGALLHDVGKLVISTQILNKKGAMTEEEMSVMKTHCVQGCNIISIFDQSGKNEFIKYTYNICRFHHEHWDGTGYPSGVKEDAIPICAQATALATELDFFTNGGVDFTDRNVEGIFVSRGTKYSNEMTKAFENALEEIKKAKDKINALDDMEAYSEVTRRLIEIFEIKEYSSSDNVAENYNSMMALLDATIFELDTVTGKFRRIYTTFSDFTMVPQRGDFGEDFIDLIQNDIKDEFRDEVLAYLYKAISGNIKTSLVPVSATCQIFNSFHNAYQWYRISTINMSWNPKTNNKTLLVIKNVDREIYVQSEINRISNKAKRIARDVVKYKDENEVLKATAQYDKLTGLFNKTAAAEEIEDIINEYPNSLHGMMLINIDGFKNINDRFGHKQGDAALKEFGEVIQKHFRSCDVVGRVGADEYIAFISNAPIPDVLSIKADNIASSIRKMSKESDVYTDISVSIGIAFYPKDGKTVEELFQKSDAALFQAKKAGKDRFQIFNEGTHIVKRLSEVRRRIKRSKANQNFISSLYDLRFSEEVSIVGVSEMIDRIGQEYNLNDIYIIDYDSTDMVFKWSAGSEIEKNCVTTEPLREFIDIVRLQCEDIEWICEDVKRLSIDAKKMLEENFVGSFVCEPILKNRRAAGMVMFIKENEATSWSEDMIEAFRMAAKLVRDHLLRVKAEKDNSFLRNITGILLANPGKNAHIIDETYRLLVKPDTGDGPVWGGKCYKEIYGLDKPCKDCLIKHVTRENERIEDKNRVATMVSVSKFRRLYVVFDKE